MAEKPFDYAHKNWKRVVWMSQNTNQLVDHPAIRRAMTECVESGQYSLYPPGEGIEGLADLIRNDLGLDSSYDILLTNGAIEALYIFNRAMIPPGGRVVATDPSFLPIHHQVAVGGGVMDEIDVYREPYRMTLDWAKAAFTPQTKALLLIDPLNPMGSAYPEGEVQALAGLCRERGAFLVDDVTYRDFSDSHHLATRWYPEGTVIAYSFSKTYGFAGMRIGALVAKKELMDRMRPFNTNPLSANMVVQAGAKAALETKREWLSGMLATAAANQKAVKEAVDEVPGAFIPVYPSKTNMLVIDIGETGVNPEDVQSRLLYDHDVFVRSGRYVSHRFGARFVRVSFTVPHEGALRFRDAFPRVMRELAKR